MTEQPNEFRPGPHDISADRHRTDGSKSLWLIRQLSDQTTLTRWDSTPAGIWAAPQTSTSSSISDALGIDAELTTLRAAEITSYKTPDPDILLEQLAPDSADAAPSDVDWPLDVNDYLGEDEDFYELEGLTQRYGRVNGDRIQFAEATDGSRVAFLSFEDQAFGSVLAQFDWGSESGMTSGAGSWTLTQSTPTAAVTIASGDCVEQGGGAHGFRCSTGPRGVARLIHDWITYIDDFSFGVFGAAAIELEPLDPDGELSTDQRDEWRAYLTGLSSGYNDTLYMRFMTDSPTTLALRETLRSNDTYRTIADALTKPVAGDWLRVALSEGDLAPLQ